MVLSVGLGVWRAFFLSLFKLEISERLSGKDVELVLTC
jgi:hypothetical protein